ncbi:MAG: hypothetical protein K8L97_09925 [Anaerolineae bacterium]|nr:hypothetical protein [Anaerolineae bacterium]
MVAIRLKGYVTETGDIEVEIPKDFPAGEVMLTIEAVEAVVVPIDEPPLTDAEIEELMRPKPKTGAEIVALGHTGGWEHKGITDSVEWIDEQRRKRREQREW